MTEDVQRDGELTLYRDMTRRALESIVAPHYEAWEQAGMMPRTVWNELGAAGLLGIDMPEEHGAAAAGFAVAQMAIEEMGRMCFGGLASSYNVHANIVMPYLLNLGTDEQKSVWLPQLVSGKAVGAIAMTEPGAGSDLAGIRTSAVRDGTDWVLNGSKIFITNGIHADLVIVAAKTGAAAGAKGISLFLANTSSPGFQRGKRIEKIGQHASDTAELFFDDLRVPAAALLGVENHGFFHMMEELSRERIGCAVLAVGSAQGALDVTIDYVSDRRAFGKAISEFQNTRFKLAEIHADIELSRTYLEKCMAKFELGSLAGEEAAILKLASTEMQCRTVDACLQLFGGYGYTAEYPISRFYTDARIQPIYGGTSEIMKEIISRSLFAKN